MLIHIKWCSMNVCNRRLENYHTVGCNSICAIRRESSFLNGEQSTLHFIIHGKPLKCSWNIFIIKKQIIQQVALTGTPSDLYQGADKSLARPTSRYILFDGENVSFDASLVICINSTNIPPIMIINRNIWKSKSSVAVDGFLPGRAKELSAPLYKNQCTVIKNAKQKSHIS